MTELRQSLATGAFWMVLFRFSTRFIGLISTVILARLLIPSDFGVVALAATAIAILTAVTEFGPETYLISKQDAESNEYDTAWTLQIFRGVAIGCVISTGATWLSEFFSEPRLREILLVLCVGIVLHGFTNIGVVNFRKNLEFKKDFNFLMIPRLISFIVTITFAFSLRSYWALVIGMLTSQLASLGYSYIISDYRPKISFRSFTKVFRFSKWIFASSLLQFLTHKFDTFLIGKQSDVQSLGYYSLSYEISTLATSEIAAPIRRAILPGFAKIAKEPRELKTLYFDVFALTVLIALPVALGIAASGDLIVKLFLGDNWLPTIPLIEALALCGALQAIGAGAGPLFAAVGQPRLIMFVNLGTLLFQVPAMLWAIQRYEVLGVAWALVAVWCWRQLLVFYFVRQLLHTNSSEHILPIWRTLLAAGIMFGLLLLLRTHLQMHGWPPAAELLAVTVAGMVVFTGTLWALWSQTVDPNCVEKRIFEWWKVRRSKF